MYRSQYQETLYLAVLLHSGPENLILATAHIAFPIPTKLLSLPKASTDIKEECLFLVLIYFLVVLHSIIYIFLTLLNLIFFA